MSDVRTRGRETRERGKGWEPWGEGLQAPLTSFPTPPHRRGASHRVLRAAPLAGGGAHFQGHSLGSPPLLSLLVGSGPPRRPTVASHFCHKCLDRGRLWLSASLCPEFLFAWASLPSCLPRSLGILFPALSASLTPLGGVAALGAGVGGGVKPEVPRRHRHLGPSSMIGQGGPPRPRILLQGRNPQAQRKGPSPLDAKCAQRRGTCHRAEPAVGPASSCGRAHGIRAAAQRTHFESE